MAGTATLQVFQNRETGEFLIESYAVHAKYGYDVAVGALTRLSADEMRDRGLQLILDDLIEYHKRQGPAPSERASMSNVDRARFNRSHACVFIEEVDGHQLKLFPMKLTKRGVFESIPDAVRTLSARVTNQDFSEALSGSLRLSN